MKRLILLFIIFVIVQCCAVSKNVINIAYTIDNNYPVYTLLSINSILKNGNSDFDYRFYIIESDVTDKNKKLMRDYVTKSGNKIYFIHLDINKITEGKEVYTWLAPIAIARIIIPDIIPEGVHRILYLDGDTLVTGDISDVYNTDLGNYYAGMVRDIRSKEIMGKRRLDYMYHNSGLILIDVDKWRKFKISEKMVSYLHNNLDRLVRQNLADQDVINDILGKNIKTLPDNWNNQTFGVSNLTDTSIPGMIHYVSTKPWKTMFEDEITPEYNLYYEYWNRSGLKRHKYINICNLLFASLNYKNVLAFYRKLNGRRYFDTDNYTFLRYTLFGNY